jgi:hypothetical protein
MATSLADAAPDLLPHLRNHTGTVLTTAEGVALGAALGVTLGTALTYFLQRRFRLQTAHITGQVSCGNAPLVGADIVLVGEYGPAANGVFAARSGADGRWAVDVAPGLYSASVQPQDGPQIMPGMVQADTDQTVHVAWAVCG